MTFGHYRDFPQDNVRNARRRSIGSCHFIGESNSLLGDDRDRVAAGRAVVVAVDVAAVAVLKGRRAGAVDEHLDRLGEGKRLLGREGDRVVRRGVDGLLELDDSGVLGGV